MSNELSLKGVSILANRYLNKGTAFTLEERKQFGILARLPPCVESIDDQISRAYDIFSKYEKPINKYMYLANLHQSNTTLFYALVLRYAEEMLPIVYTPTVGEACQKFGSLYTSTRGFYLESSQQGNFRYIFSNSNYHDVEIIVVTDGSRILGLGDLGSNGVGISLGKCSLYVVGAGFKPRRSVPIMMDMGTNNEVMRGSFYYMGQRIPRVDDKTFYMCMDEFMDAIANTWPRAVVQFEDFSNNHCFDVLARYQYKYRCFNDDIQGTGAVVSAGFINALKVSGLEPLKHKIIVFGAGSAAVGVVNCITQLVAKIYGCTQEEMRQRFYLVDTKGLVTANRGDVLADHKVPFAHKDIDAETSKKLVDLLDIINFVQPTGFIGLGGAGRVLTKDMVNVLLKNSTRPIIFPLSNPTSKAEIDAKDAYEWTNGAAIVASGSPFPPTVVNGKVCIPSQGNNMYVFPGLGFGVSLAQPPHVSDEIILESAICLQKLVSKEDIEKGLLYPSLSNIREVSAQIAAVVIQKCQQDGTGGKDFPTKLEDIVKVVKEKMWRPVYGVPMSLNDI